VGGVTYKIEAAAQSGIRKVIIPWTNKDDVLIEEAYKDQVEIIPVKTISEVIEHSLVGTKKEGIREKLKELTDMKVDLEIPESIPG
jgi:Lon-like ATP-dependent protease